MTKSMSLKRVKIAKATAAVMATAVLSAGEVAFASQAEAATVTCNGQVAWWSVKHSKYLYVPVYTNSSGVDNRSCELKQGAGPTGGAGSATHTLQVNLNECYGENLKTDGDFGSATKAALIRAQRRAGVDDDGVYGPITASYLKFAVWIGVVVTKPCYSFYG